MTEDFESTTLQERLRTACTTAAQTIERSELIIQTIHASFRRQLEIFRMHDSSSEQAVEITGSFSEARKKIVTVYNELATQLQIIESFEAASLGGNDVMRIHDLKMKLQELSRDSKRFIVSIDEAFSPENVSPNDARQHEQVQILTGDEILDWLRDIHVGDRMISNNGTLRRILIVDAGPYLYTLTKKYNTVQQRYLPAFVEKFTLESLEQRYRAIRCVERDLSKSQ